MLQCDASSMGLGAAILQNGQPIGYASRGLTETESRYAQIEKELLAIMFGLEGFDTHTYGRHIIVESDHKPLETIHKKPLRSAPKRLQRILLRLQRYDITVQYKKGKEMVLADTPSRAWHEDNEPLTVNSEEVCSLETVNAAQFLLVTKESIEKLQQSTTEDEVMSQLKLAIQQGWPDNKKDAHPLVVPYYNVRDKLLTHNGLVFKGERVVILTELRKMMLERIHYSHIGTNGCIRRAKECVYWPGMTLSIRNRVEKCETCRMFERRQEKES